MSVSLRPFLRSFIRLHPLPQINSCRNGEEHLVCVWARQAGHCVVLIKWLFTVCERCCLLLFLLLLSWCFFLLKTHWQFWIWFSLKTTLFSSAKCPLIPLMVGLTNGLVDSKRFCTSVCHARPPSSLLSKPPLLKHTDWQFGCCLLWFLFLLKYQELHKFGLISINIIIFYSGPCHHPQKLSTINLNCVHICLSSTPNIRKTIVGKRDD